MPVVSVSLKPARDSSSWKWPPQTIVSERHKSRHEAEERSIEIAKQMIDQGKFRSSQATRSPHALLKLGAVPRPS